MEKGRAIELLEHLAWDKDNEGNCYGEALNIAIDALKAQLSQEGTISDTISRQAAINALTEKFKRVPTTAIIAKDVIENLPPAQPEKEIPKRVLWSGWKGIRNTRYKCPNCKKPVRNTDVYCHRCGQKLMFPNIGFTPYVEGQKQELIVRWDDEEICGKKLRG